MAFYGFQGQRMEPLKRKIRGRIRSSLPIDKPAQPMLPSLNDRFWPILLKKSVCPNCLIIDW